MKPLLITSSILVVVLTIVSVILWTGVFGNNAPEGWTTYQNEEIGFTIAHPEEMELYYEQEASVGFALRTPADDHGLYFGVAKVPLYDQTLEQIAQEQAWTGDIEPITLVGQQGYRFLGDEDDSIEWWGIVLPLTQTEYLGLSYSFNFNNQGYQQIVEQMLASFEVRERGAISPIAIIFGIVLVTGVLISFGLLFLMKRSV